ncbi:MAG: MATE family efflux transporter [Leptolyngbyaceae cyanobacterium]
MKMLTITPAVRSEVREFLRLALPLAGAQVAQALTGFVDTLMMGRLGQDALAAGGLAVMVFMAALMTGIGTVSSVSPLAAAAYGAGQSRQIGFITRQGLWLAFVISILVAPSLGNLTPLMQAFGQAPVVVDLSSQYLKIICWSLLPALWFAVLRCTATALAHTRPILYIMVGANLFNIMANYALAFGKWGFPAMELRGLAIASALSHLIMCLSLIAYIVYHRHCFFRPYRLLHHWWRWHLPTIKQLLWLGVPIGIVNILENGLFTVMTLMVGALGTHVLAAQQLALQTVIIVFMVPLGMAFAATARVGQWYGQRDWAGVKRAAMVSVSLTILVMSIAGVIFVIFPTPLIRLYLDVEQPGNQAVLKTAIAMLTVAGFGQIVDGVQRTANGILQGLQDTRIPMLLSLVAYWGVGLATGYWLGFHTSWGGVGIWIGAYIGLAIAAIAYIWRFRHLVHAHQPPSSESY